MKTTAANLALALANLEAARTAAQAAALELAKLEANLEAARVAVEVARKAAKPAPVATERAVNRALAKAGVPVTVCKRNGYLSIETLDCDGPEVASIFVCYWHEMSLERWVAEVTANYEAAAAKWHLYC
jgi:hypothetical protein